MMSEREEGAMQTVTVAIADIDPGRRRKLEQFLRDGPGITVLGNVMPNGSDRFIEPEAGTHAHFMVMDDLVARVSEAKPRVLFVDLDYLREGDFALLEALHRESPETLVLLLTNKSAREEQILQGLANGARGCLSHEADPFYFIKAVRVVDQGEIWVTRRMLGKIMDKVLH